LDLLRDPVASASHFLMAGLAVVATLFLVRLAGDRPRRLSVLVFGLCMIAVYSASGLYHALRLPPAELRVYQRIDMSAIYLMIAGTCTPVACIMLRGRFRMSLLTGVWLLALVGIGSGSVAVAPAAMLSDIVPDHASATAVGVFRFFGDLGFVFGPLVAGVTANAIGFKGAFALMALPLLVTLALVARTPETLARQSA